MDQETALGARIRAFRERLGLQGQELAEAIDLDPSAVSNIERGKRMVKTNELARIAEVLQISPLALLDDTSLSARLPIAPRAGKGPIASGTAYKRLLALTELHEVLQEAEISAQPALDGIPKVNDPDLSGSAKALAAWASKYLDVKSQGEERFVALATSIEDMLGVDVIVEQHSGDVLAGATISDRSFPLLFVNSEQPTPRALFTLAHELGHLVLGHGEAIALDDTFAGTTDEEKWANVFAAAFLMPEDEVRTIIDRQGRGAASLAYLTYHFGVSYESLIYRLHSLREINAAGRDRLQAIGWHGLLDAIEREDFRDKITPEIRKSLASRQGNRPERRSPGWLVKRTREGYRRGVVSVRPLAGLLAEDPDELIDSDNPVRPDDDFSFGSDAEVATQDEGLGDSPV